MKLPTPHIAAAKGDFAETVLMPGDPLRSAFIAENFLENARLVNNVRGVQGYTGVFHGLPVSVMASGMGMPAISIYATELFEGYGVENIVRVGTAGSLREDVKLHDIVIAAGACTDSSLQDIFGVPGHFSAIASFDLLRTAVEEAERSGVAFHVGNILSTDAFYSPQETLESAAFWGNLSVLAVEMEAAALYFCAARQKKRALTICTISDHLLTGEEVSSEEREKTFTGMVSLALNAALRF